MRPTPSVSIVFLLLSTSLVCFADETTNRPRWSAGAGWSYTSLGKPRPGGFGATGGNTAMITARRVLADPSWGTIDASIVLRGYGFEQPGPRTVGVEGDVGVVVARRLFGLGTNDGMIWLGASAGAFRSPFATAFGRWRWIGVRPSLDLGVRVIAKDGWTIDASCNARRYDVLVWSGWSVSGSVVGGWSW